MTTDEFTERYGPFQNNLDVFRSDLANVIHDATPTERAKARRAAFDKAIEIIIELVGGTTVLAELDHDWQPDLPKQFIDLLTEVRDKGGENPDAS